MRTKSGDSFSIYLIAPFKSIQDAGAGSSQITGNTISGYHDPAAAENKSKKQACARTAMHVDSRPRLNYRKGEVSLAMAVSRCGIKTLDAIIKRAKHSDNDEAPADTNSRILGSSRLSSIQTWTIN